MSNPNPNPNPNEELDHESDPIPVIDAPTWDGPEDAYLDTNPYQLG